MSYFSTATNYAILQSWRESRNRPINIVNLKKVANTLRSFLDYLCYGKIGNFQKRNKNSIGEVVYIKSNESYILLADSIIKGHGFNVNTFSDPEKTFTSIKKPLDKYISIVSKVKFKSLNCDEISFMTKLKKLNYVGVTRVSIFVFEANESDCLNVSFLDDLHSNDFILSDKSTTDNKKLSQYLKIISLKINKASSKEKKL